MEFARMTTMPSGAADRVVALVGVGLIVVGFGFKLALVPFHLWTPDVYQGAPAPVTAFVATVSKGAMFAVLLRYFTIIDVRAHHTVFLIFAILAIASMVVGNLLALLQSNVKRLLAYSSIAHLGYLVVAFLASGALAATAITFYLVAYFVTTIGAFGVVTVLSSADSEAEDLDEYRGLFARRPWLSVVFTAMLLSLAGIPLTAGFVGKFYLTVAAGGAALWSLLIVMMITSGIGLFYYLRDRRRDVHGVCDRRVRWPRAVQAAVRRRPHALGAHRCARLAWRLPGAAHPAHSRRGHRWRVRRDRRSNE